MSLSSHNSRNSKQSIEDSKQQHDRDRDRDYSEDNYLAEQMKHSSKHHNLHYERKFKQIESVDEEAQINRQLRLRANQQKYSPQPQPPSTSSSNQYRQLRHHSTLVKARRPIIIENVKIKHKLKRHSSAVSPRTSSSSLHSSSASPVNIDKDTRDSKSILNNESTKNKQSNNRLSPQHQQQQQQQEQQQNLPSKYQELKNRLFLLEIELENERKKLIHEKENKSKTISELKSRFEIEKTAALKALEARLNAEKLEEFNKYKENAEIEKSNEIDYLTKTKETELTNLKLKLREKSEKCLKLESIIKEERSKLNQSHQKSFEVIEKYSNELKFLKAQMSTNENIVNIKTKQSSIEYVDRTVQTVDVVELPKYELKQIETSMQTDSMDESNNNNNLPNDFAVLVEKLKKVHSSLIKNNSVENNDNTKVQYLKLVDEIDEHVKKFNKRIDEIDDDRRKLNDNLEIMKKDYKQIKESKSKLEVLYKIKCKSDLDKSSAIKKLKLDYELELMKFRTEENGDLVRHLEKQLSMKDMQLLEQSFELETWRSHETTLNSLALCSGAANGVGNSMTSSFNHELSSSHNTFFNTSLNSQKNNSNGLLVKKVPVDILYTSDPDVVTSTNRRSVDDKDHKVCLQKTKELQNKIIQLEKQLVSERVKQNFYQNTEELDKLLQQSNKEKILLERELALKYSQLIQTQTNSNNNSNNNSNKQQQQQTPIKNITKLPERDFSINSNNESNSTSTTGSRRTSISHYMQPPTTYISAIDPLHYSALQDTNDALKAEISRLAPLEQKCKILEEKASNADSLKDTCDKQETEIKALKEYKKRSESLEKELNQLKKKYEDEHAKLIEQEDKQKKSLTENKSKQNNLINLEQENKKLKQNLEELDRKLKDSEKQIENLNNKEIIIEKLNRSLETELNELKVINVNSELQKQKLLAIEHANRILEEELNTSKKKTEQEIKNLNEIINQQKLKLKNFEHIEELNKQLNENLNSHQQNNQLNEIKLREENEVLKQQVENLNEYKNQCKNYETKIIDFEQKLKSLDELNENLTNENLNLKSLSKKIEQRLNENIKIIHDKEIDFENLQLDKENDLIKMDKLIKTIENENTSLKNLLTSKDDEILSLKNEFKNANVNYQSELNEKFSTLSLDYEKLLSEFDSLNQTLSVEREEFNKNKLMNLNENENLIRRLNEEISKNENINRNYSNLNMELNELKNNYEILLKEHENLVKIEQDYKTAKANLDENSKFKENFESLQKKHKALTDKYLVMENELLLKDQENKNFEKLIDSEKAKTTSLLKQIEDITFVNNELTTQFKETKTKYEEFEASLRESIEKKKEFESNNETIMYELKKKQDELKKLQQIHETMKKENRDTIEILEEKIKDLEKKTELQALKHEEIMLELESMRAKRDRLLPVCPHCNTQTIQLYHSQQQQLQLQNYQTLNRLTHNVAVQTVQNQFDNQYVAAANTIQNDQQKIEVHDLVNKNQTAKNFVSTETKPKTENKEINTEPFDFKQKISTKDESIDVNLINFKKQESKEKFDKATQSDFSFINSQTFGLYICKFSYSPLDNSPNDNPEIELPLVAGDYIFVLSERDDDGFYTGETLDGKRGLIPSNFVEKVQNLNKETFQQIFTKSLMTKFNEPDKNDSKLNKAQQINGSTNVIDRNSSTSVNTVLSSVNDIKQLDRLNSNSSNKILTSQPFPINLKVEKLENNTIVVTWDPPPILPNVNSDNTKQTSDIPEQLIVNYQFYLNHELHSLIKPNQNRYLTIDKIDFTKPNRVSIQAITQKGASKPQECTLLFGPAKYYPPTHLKVYSLTQTSAIVSWWPSSSNVLHTILINDVEHRTLKAGIYRFKLSGLVPNTKHNVTITAQMPNMKAEDFNNYAANIEFFTLAIPCPTNVRLQKASTNSDLYTLLWQPVPNDPNTNTSPIAGYSIYLDGIMVHQILDPKANMINLNTKLLSKGAKHITIRSICSDGNTESKDSEILLLSSPENNEKSSSETSAITNNNDDVTYDSYTNNQTITSTSSINTNNNINLASAMNQSLNTTTKHTNEISFNNASANNFPTVNEKRSNEFSYKNIPRDNDTLSRRVSDNSMKQYEPQPYNEQPSYYEVDHKIYYQTDQNYSTLERGNKHLNKLSSNNNLNEPPIKSPSKSLTHDKHYKSHSPQSPRSPHRTHSPNNQNHSHSPHASHNHHSQHSSQHHHHSHHSKSKHHENNNELKEYDGNYKPSSSQNKRSSLQPNETLEEEQTRKNSKKSSKSSKHHKENENSSYYQSNETKAKINKIKLNSQLERVFIALFNYDPYTMSPNVETCHEELPFIEGQFIKIYGEQDADGFFFGESQGKSGFVPCNMVSEVQVDDPFILQQLLNDINNPNQQNKINESKSDSKTFGQTTDYNNRNQNYKPPPQRDHGHDKQNACQMMALYDYDPQSLSPNSDMDTELSFKAGDIITVYGEMDDDGFYMGELNGKRGLVPSNFLQIVNHKYNKSSPYTSKSGDPIKIVSTIQYS